MKKTYKTLKRWNADTRTLDCIGIEMTAILKNGDTFKTISRVADGDTFDETIGKDICTRKMEIKLAKHRLSVAKELLKYDEDILRMAQIAYGKSTKRALARDRELRKTMKVNYRELLKYREDKAKVATE